VRFDTAAAEHVVGRIAGKHTLSIYPDDLSFGTVRVQTPSGDAYEFDVSDIQAD
jgi:hypothetical protein